MSNRRKFTEEFKAGAVELVISSGRSTNDVATDLGVKEGTLGNWVRAWKAEHPDAGADEPGPVEWAKYKTLQAENAALKRENEFLDNGASMGDKSLARTCAKLGIRLVHSAPYRPQGRGKIERFFSTVTSQFLGEITVTDTPMLPGTDPAAGSQISSLKELNTLFTGWMNMVYHHQQHTSTGQTPLARWEASWEHREPVRKSLDQIREAFLWSDVRTVTKTGTVSLHSNTYEVDPLLAGTKVELVYDPFGLDGQVTVNNHHGQAAGQAKVLKIGRHVHSKVTNAVKDNDTSANISTGINYLDLVATRHRESLTAAPISFADLHKNNEQETESIR